MTPFDCVVDANVAAKLFVNEPDAERAEALFLQLDAEMPPLFSVPDLFFIECANIFWKYARRGQLTEQAVRQSMSRLMLLPFQSVATTELTEEALGLAMDRDIAAYDAAYAVLARRLNVPLITADRPLVKRLRDTAIQVQPLDEWTPPSDEDDPAAR